MKEYNKEVAIEKTELQKIIKHQEEKHIPSVDTVVPTVWSGLTFLYFNTRGDELSLGSHI